MENLTVDKEKEDKKERFAFINTALTVLLILSIVMKLFFINGIIPSESMLPMLKKGDLIIINKLSFAFSDPENQDVVIFKHNDDFVIKRVIGKPGDTVLIKDGSVYLNGKELKESYLLKQNSTFLYSTNSDEKEYKVPEGKYFVLGDNRENSLDSREFDNVFIDKEDIVGGLLFKYGNVSSI